MKEYCDKTKIDELINGAVSNIKSLVNMETVIGEAVDMGNDCKAYPVIKITVGVVAGGGEYSNKIVMRKGGNFPFAGGTGAGFTAEPVGFLISRPNSCELVTIQGKNTMNEVFNKLGDVMSDYIKKVLSKKAEEQKNDSKNE